MRRRRLKLVLFLLAFLVGGAIINVAVAWIIEIGPRSKFSWSEPMPADDAKRLSRDHIGTEYPRGFRLHRAFHRVEHIDNHENLSVIKFSVGCPCLTLFMVRAQPPYGYPAYRGRLDVAGDSNWAVPLFPIWPGFAINTIFYAAIAWGLFAVPGMVRRRVWRKRGQCVKCAYPVGPPGSEKCTECGAEVAGH